MTSFVIIVHWDLYIEGHFDQYPVTKRHKDVKFSLINSSLISYGINYTSLWWPVCVLIVSNFITSSYNLHRFRSWWDVIYDIFGMVQINRFPTLQKLDLIWFLKNLNTLNYLVLIHSQPRYWYTWNLFLGRYLRLLDSIDLKKTLKFKS